MVFSILLIPNTHGSFFWSNRRKQLALNATLFALVLGLVLSWIIGTPQGSALARGDFPAFFSAAKIVSDGQGAKLYDHSAQLNIQAEHWPETLSDSIMMYAYPPYVAWLLQPLAMLDGPTAKIVFDFLLLLSLSVSALLIGNRNSIGPKATLVALLVFSPLLHATFASQNTAISILLLTLILINLSKESKHGDYWIGLALGLWLFKPQFPALLMLLFLISKRYRPLLVASAIGILFYLMAATVSGFWWIPEWLSAATSFADTDRLINSHQMISILGVFSAASFNLSAWEFFQHPNLHILARIFQVLCLTECIVIFLELRRLGTIDRNKLSFPALKAAIPLILLGSEHLLYYDISLLLPLALLCPISAIRWSYNSFIFFCAICAALIAFKSSLPIQPLFLVLLLATFYWNKDFRAQLAEVKSH